MSFHGGFRGGFTRQSLEKPMAYCTWRNEEEYHRERIERERERERRRQWEAQQAQARAQAEAERLARQQAETERLLIELERDRERRRQREAELAQAHAQAEAERLAREQAETEKLLAWRREYEERSKRATEAAARWRELDQIEKREGWKKGVRAAKRQEKRRRETLQVCGPLLQAGEEWEPFEVDLPSEIRSQLGLISSPPSPIFPLPTNPFNLNPFNPLAQFRRRRRHERPTA